MPETCRAHHDRSGAETSVIDPVAQRSLLAVASGRTACKFGKESKAAVEIAEDDVAFTGHQLPGNRGGHDGGLPAI